MKEAKNKIGRINPYNTTEAQMSGKSVDELQLEENALPAKCAESEFARIDGGIKSADAARANQGGDRRPESELDWVDTCALNQTDLRGPVQGGPEPHHRSRQARK